MAQYSVSEFLSPPFLSSPSPPSPRAPEVIRATDKASDQAYDGAKADVWAMGVLLCVMLIGKFPFEGDTVSTRTVTDPVIKVSQIHVHTSTFPHVFTLMSALFSKRRSQSIS